MNMLVNTSPLVLWQDLVKHAEERCAISLKSELETYLINLLMRYSNKPEIVKQILATAYLEALSLKDKGRQFSLQHVGDQCLIFAGLFPHVAEKRLVKISYFVNLGRSAYSIISQTTNDLFGSLALQFVVLMDVLQSIRHHSDLLPLEAYDLWNDVNSRRAFKFLQEYTKSIPFKSLK